MKQEKVFNVTFSLTTYSTLFISPEVRQSLRTVPSRVLYRLFLMFNDAFTTIHTTASVCCPVNHQVINLSNVNIFQLPI